MTEPPAIAVAPDWTDSVPLRAPRADAVYVFRLRLPAAPVETLADLLDAAERERVDRIACPRTGRRFTATRGTLRLILGRYLGRDPRLIRFTYGPLGKPRLREKSPPLAFNLSHSGDLVLYAVTRNRRVGIDVERRRVIPRMEPILRRLFTPLECAAILALPEPRRTQAFLAAWTRKEAMLKARGTGLWGAWDGAGAMDDVAGWQTVSLDVGADYAAAVTVEGTLNKLQCINWDGQSKGPT